MSTSHGPDSRHPTERGLPEGPRPAEQGLPEGPRREARERALSLLYESELKREPVADVIGSLRPGPDPFVVELLQGTEKHLSRIDALVSSAAVGWEIDRMPVIDRSLLRLGTYELLETPETPVAVIIDEAVELAKRYSTEQSGGFVNGVLSTIARNVRPAPDATGEGPGEHTQRSEEAPEAIASQDDSEQSG
ncbi:MAG TPA: transcription antitermination factor NusB [Acidimicrobiales bacterium]|nr:transcription antitermination factor NusB [Acidimicrobiales bacterium]